MDLAEDCEEDFEAAEYSCRENAVTSDAHVEATCGVLGNGGGTPRYFSLHFHSFFFSGGSCDGIWDMEGSGGVGVLWNGGGEGFLCHTIAGFLKAVGRIAVRGEDYDGVA